MRANDYKNKVLPTDKSRHKSKDGSIQVLGGYYGCDAGDPGYFSPEERGKYMNLPTGSFFLNIDLYRQSTCRESTSDGGQRSLEQNAFLYEKGIRFSLA